MALQRHAGPKYSFLLEVGTPVKRLYAELDLNLEKLLITREDCQIAEGGKCDSKVVFDPTDSSTETELYQRRRKTTYHDY